MAGGNDNDDAQVRRWIEESKGLYANVANEAWLEWGQDILPHLAKTSKDSEQVETEEMLDDEFDTRMDQLFDMYLDKTKTMTKDVYEAKKKEIESEFEKRRNKLREAMDEAAKASLGDQAKSKTRESALDTLGGESRIAENVGEVEDVDKVTAGSKEGKGKGERGAEAINVDDDADEDLAKTSDARGGSKVIEAKAIEKGEAAKTSDKAKEIVEVDRIAEKKSRLRLMTPGRHDFRKVSGPVRSIFLNENLIADLDFVVRSLREFKSNLRLFEGFFPLCEV
jgi:hypothetical protein